MLIRRNPFYALQEISGIFYLLPFGQMISDRGHGIQVNETGCYLWELLKDFRTMEEILSLCAKHYRTSAEEMPLLEKDLEAFVEKLLSCGVLENMPDFTTRQIFPDRYLEIGGLIIRFSAPAEAFPPSFSPFLMNTSGECPNFHLHVALHIGKPRRRINGRVLVRNEELIVMETEDSYILLFPAASQITEAKISKDAAKAIIYFTPPYREDFCEQLSGVMRLVYLLLAGTHHMAALHSSSILYGGKAWLFSASSGTGKSTHADLWQDFLNVPILNGDLNLLAFRDKEPVIHGIPWCGTSRIFDTETYPLGGIILLKQAKEDFVEELSSDKKQLFLLQRLITPSWNRDMQKQNLQFVEKLSGRILICRLHCTPMPSAVETVLKTIKNFM
ncbi:MAG: PqqD family protein [Bacteroidales bacterium]|nr:PqqD family protein [Lachnoclostridium sp.]MCM1383639.1 PqqD family protein [Lachnoclostridium sp.]MCM1465721.1 PqqD family protein [Bacteroidales bacterium]